MFHVWMWRCFSSNLLSLTIMWTVPQTVENFVSVRGYYWFLHLLCGILNHMKVSHKAKKKIKLLYKAGRWLRCVKVISVWTSLHLSKMARVRKSLYVVTAQNRRGLDQGVVLVVWWNLNGVKPYGSKSSMGTDSKLNRLENSWLREESKPGKRIRNSYEFGLRERSSLHTVSWKGKLRFMIKALLYCLFLCAKTDF